MKYLSILMVGVALLAGGCGEVEVSDGTEIVYLDDGSKGIETPYVQGKIHGTRISYHEDGRIEFPTSEIPRRRTKSKEISYVDDKEHGTAIGYYEDGSKHWEAQYVDGKMHGKEISYREDGSKASRHERRFLTARTPTWIEASETPTWTTKCMARGLRTARTDLSGLKPYTKTAKRSPEKISNPL